MFKIFRTGIKTTAILICTTALFYILWSGSYCTDTRQITEQQNHLDFEFNKYMAMQPKQLNAGISFLPSSLDHSIESPGARQIFYVWCGPPRHFLFVNYVSMLSIIRLMRPEAIVFYFENYPVVDKSMYYTWFGELLDMYPFIRTIKLNNTASEKCSGHVPVLSFVKDITGESSGVYVGEFTIVSQRMYGVLCDKQIHALDNDTRYGIYKMTNADSSDESKQDTDVVRNCCVAHRHLSEDSASRCVTASRDITPESIWTENSAFGRLVRWAAYGDEAMKMPVRAPLPVVPDIAHMIWFGGESLSLTFYLSVLSVLYISELERLYIHGDIYPTGEFWERVRNHPSLTFVKRNSSHRVIFGKDVRRIVHWADVVRVDILLRYGGVYIDTDVVFVQPLPVIFREYDAVVPYTFPYVWPQPFPNYINNGVLIGKPGSAFFAEYQRSMKPFLDWYFGWNGMMKPFKILERNPGLARLSHHLQLGCCDGLCHPTWWPEDKHRPWNKHHLNSGIPLDWRTESVTVHFMGSCPPSLRSLANLKSSEDMFGDIGRFVLKKAASLDILHSVD